MSLNCSRYKNQRYIWTSLLLATVVGCGILIYMSYIHGGTTKESKASCLKCKDNSINPPEKLTQKKCQQTCTTKECVLAASRLLKNMNTSADPCENFYSFMCGNVLQNFGEEETFSVVMDMGRATKLQLKGILENLKHPYDELSRKVKMVYDSCMNNHASEVNAIPTAIDFLRDVGIEGWPHLDANFRFTHISMEESLGKMIAYAGFFILNFHATNDEKHSKDGLYNFTIVCSSPLMYNDNRLSKFEKAVFQILNYLDVDTQNARRIWEDFKSIDAFLLNLTQVYPDDDSPNILGYSCKENKNTSLCDVLKYVVKYTNNTERYSSDFAYLHSPQRTENVLNSLQTFTHRSVANYLALRFFFKHLPDMNTAFQVLYSDIEEFYVDRYVDQPRFSIDKWENCINWLTKHMLISLGKVYLLNTNYADKTEEIQGIFLTVREETANLFSQQQWMEDTKREELKNIIENLSNELGTLNSDILKTGSFYLEQFHPTNESFLRNSLEYWHSYFKFLSVNLLIELPEFNPFQVNAFMAENGLSLTYGMIRPPVYKYGLPKLFNLVTLSESIGHEFGHHVWDFFANLEDNDSTSVEYKKKKKCLENQYSNFELKKIGKKVNGTQTLSENLADLIGYGISDKIINKYAAQENVNSTFVLPGLEFTTKQLLYIAMSQMWCETNSHKLENFNYMYSRYASSEARVTTMYRNLKGFSEAFMCSPGSNMNPADKCTFFNDPSV